MTKERLLSAVTAATLVAAASAQVACAAGFDHLTRRGAYVVSSCNPDDKQANSACRVDSIPGAPGFTQVDQRSNDIVRNGVTIGRASERVWRSDGDSSMYIFGVQVTLDDVPSDGEGRVFRINDLVRRTQKFWSVSVAYEQDVAPHALHQSGRTAQALNEYDGDEPDRDDSWVDFRIVVDPTASGASTSSPWLLTRTRAPKGYTTNDFGLRLVDSDFEHPKRQAVDLYLPGFEPVGVPAGQ